MTTLTSLLVLFCLVGSLFAQYYEPDSYYTSGYGHGYRPYSGGYRGMGGYPSYRRYRDYRYYDGYYPRYVRYGRRYRRTRYGGDYYY